MSTNHAFLQILDEYPAAPNLDLTLPPNILEDAEGIRTIKERTERYNLDDKKRP